MSNKEDAIKGFSEMIAKNCAGLIRTVIEKRIRIYASELVKMMQEDNKNNNELKEAPDFLVSVANELKSFIDQKNEVLKKAITCTDLDDPDYHDYESCFELKRLADKIKGLNND